MSSSNFKNLSLESLEINDGGDLGQHHQRRYRLDESHDSLISLEDIYETISLYDENGDLQHKRLTWEEWYTMKRLQALQGNKKSSANDSKSADGKKGKSKKLTQEQKEEILTNWLVEKEKNRIRREQRLQQEKALKESEKQKSKDKSEEQYQKWLSELKAKERKLREEQEEKKRQEAEKEAKKKIEAKRRSEALRKQLDDQRAKIGLANFNFKDRVSYGVKSNGQAIPYYDRSANPKPAFVNPQPWVD